MFKNNLFKKISGNRRFTGGCAAVLMAAIIGIAGLSQTGSEFTFTTFSDPEAIATIKEEEPPEASAPIVTTKTSTKSSVSNVKLASKATKTYTRSLSPTTKTSSKTTTSSTKKVVTSTTVKTTKTEKYTKGSKTKRVTTKVTTVVKTTTTTLTKATTTAATAKKYVADIKTLAPLMDTRVVNAFTTLGFTVTVDPSVSYSGYFKAADKSITLRAADYVIYHELGHFLAFIAGSVDTKSDFVAIYQAEASKMTGASASYAQQNSSEYFAESVSDYILHKADLKANRPQTYAAIESALNKVTDTQVAKVKAYYAKFGM